MTEINIEFNEKTHRYKVNGEYFPSVTTIIDKVVPKNLVWWGMVVGVNATTKLYEEGLIYEGMETEEIVSLIREHRLSVYHIRDEKGEEGSAVHRAAERYAKYGEIPDLGKVPVAARPRLRGLANFFIDYRPLVLRSEHRVASLEHRYAGTYDWRVQIDGPNPLNLVGEGIIDLKTGKRVYPDSQFPQLEAYEKAAVECGENPSAFKAILHLDAEGEYNLVPSTDSFEDFLVLVNHYYSSRQREQRLKECG